MSTQQLEYWTQIQAQQFIQHDDTVLELSPDMSHTPSLSGSPVTSEFESFAPPHVYQPPFAHINTDEVNFPYQLPMTPSDFGSTDDTAYCSPVQQQHMGELSFPPLHSPISATSVPSARPPPPTAAAAAAVAAAEHRTHATSGRRRAQNRAAQRAFRERKEKHARDLEVALSALSDKYQSLETSHAELSAAYEKLKKTIELLTKDDDGTDEARSGHSKETLRSLLEIIHGEVGARAASAKQ